MKTVRICVIGAGRMANMVHYPSLALYEGAVIVGICDLDEHRLYETAKKYNISNTFTNYREMLEKCNPDGVFVILPPQYMYDVVFDCINNGFPVYCEKPMGLNMHQATMLTVVSQSKGVITQVGHQRRSSPLLKKILETCRQSGPVDHAVCEFYKFDTKPMYSPCDHIHDDCSHSVDTLRCICGGKIVSIESQCKRIDTPDINWVLATLKFDNGSTGVLINSWASGRRVFRVEIHSKGIYADVELEKEAHIYKEGDYEGQRFDSKEVAGSNEFYQYAGFREKHREFIESIRSGIEQTSSPFRDVLETMRAVETILAQNLH